MEDDTHRIVPDLIFTSLQDRIAEVGYAKLYQGAEAAGEAFASFPIDPQALVSRGLLPWLNEGTHAAPDILAAIAEAIAAEIRANTISGSKSFTVRIMANKGSKSMTQRIVVCSCLMELEVPAVTSGSSSSLHEIDASCALPGVRAMHSSFGLIVESHMRAQPVVEGALQRALAVAERQGASWYKDNEHLRAALADERAEIRRLRNKVEDLEADLARANRPGASERIAEIFSDDDIKAQGKEVLGTVQDALVAFVGGRGPLAALRRLPDRLRERLTSEEFLKKLQRPDFVKELEDAFELLGGA